MPRYRKRQTGQDENTRQAGPSDFLNVENQRRELFPEEFAEGAAGAPPMEGEVIPDAVPEMRTPPERPLPAAPRRRPGRADPAGHPGGEGE